MSVSIKYGSTSLTLEKSDHLVAVRPSARTAEALERAAALGVQPTGIALQNFLVLDTRQAPAAMEDSLDLLRMDTQIAVGTHVYHTSDDGVPFIPTGEIYIEFRDGSSDGERQQALDKARVEVLGSPEPDAAIVRVTSASLNPVKTVQALQADAAVRIAEPDLATPGKLHSFVLPADPLMGRQWHLRNTGTHRGTSLGLKAGADARVVEAWEEAETLGSSGVIVSVIDDGFDLTHPDLVSPGKIVAPWDFTRNSNDPRPEYNATYPYLGMGGHWNGDWHGTACAGVAVGAADASGILGAAPHSRLMPVRWGTSLTDAQVEGWFKYVRIQGASVVSCSWGAQARYFPLSARKKKAIRECARQGRGGLGIPICFAAGNESRDIRDPASGSEAGFANHPDVLTIAASTSRDKQAHYSNFGDRVFLCAPSSGSGGMGVATSDVRGTFERNGVRIDAGYSVGDFTDDFGGTSSACPLVAGVCALMIAVKPQIRLSALKRILKQTARKIGPASSYNGHGHSPLFGYGCVHAADAMRELL